MILYRKERSEMMRFSIVAKKDDYSHEVEEKVKERLINEGWQYDKKHPELVICVGGDGTLLYAVHQYLHLLDDVMFLGIHTGTLGFFTDYTADELDICLHDILTQQFKIFSSRLLEIQLDQGKEVKYALNEMRVENIVKSQHMDIYVDGEFFETCHGSGICLSTQAGSTAYNRSLGGAVIDSGISLMQLAEITPIQHSKQRSLGNPYIMMENRIITMKSDTFDTAYLCYDHLSMALENTSEILCKMSNKCVRFARYRDYSYLARLKNLY